MTLKDLWNKLDVISVLGFLVALELQITNGSMQFTHTLPPAWVEIVKEWAANLASVGGALIGILRMAGNSSQPSSVTSTVVKILIAAFALSFLPGGGSIAHAQGTRSRQPQVSDPFKAIGEKIKSDVDNAGQKAASATGSGQTARDQMGCDPLNLKPGCKTAKATDDIKSLTEAMSSEMKAFANFVQGDVATASSLTTKIASLPDGNAQACYKQLKNSADIITELQATVDSGGTIGVATIYEALRLLHMNMIQTCSSSQCTQIFSEATNVVVAASPIITQIPSFTQFCAKIPSIASVAVTADASPAPLPTAMPTTVATPAAGATPAPAPSASPNP